MNIFRNTIIHQSTTLSTLALKRCIPNAIVSVRNLRSITTTTSNSRIPSFPDMTNVQLDTIVGFSKFGKGSYFIERSSSGNLPVYSDIKGGGNKIVTQISKIKGDIIQLRNDLQNALPFIEKNRWTVLMQSKKIIVKGDYVREIKDVLTKRF
ncbi:hypothetical protein TBLA_0F04120 [Henningerozyma blattae CBS 6284]|uniref:Large ribosomal subunit protein mL49 n=1 Tax=Henningerozyma blattae (strain ATCC 34711 / CBS 6284 / DSM 70876 / NBRC 10599 / NRRL Y-10934 / UCD 77-7) TaxID=1071380 RepID=I2H6E3_HENB6|nr:hypothetical protein TBLA_0F04120 [Tetrapisispora blattae CBS 6284]CCH61945.1 hypothetical protein TBLA_0F04120 [Tetrapisispora blattae CBS 6284]